MRFAFEKQSEVCNGAKSRAVIAFVTLVAFTVGAGATGFWYGQRHAAAPVETVAELEWILERERSVVEATQQESMSHLDAIAGRVGQMQAEILRLNALGERLVQMAELDAEEFDFENPPPVGGPDIELETRETSFSELANELTQMLGLISDRKRKLSQLEQSIMEEELKEQATPSGWPVLSGYITSKFGFRRHPTRGRVHFHTGIDFASKRGTPVIAVADGLVVYSGHKSGYGRMVEVRHMDGLITRYAHNQTNLAKQGELVKQGQTIAHLGSSGRTTGPHVHFEVLKDGKVVNPMKYVGVEKPKTSG